MAKCIHLIKQSMMLHTPFLVDRMREQMWQTLATNDVPFTDRKQSDNMAISIYKHLHRTPIWNTNENSYL